MKKLFAILLAFIMLFSLTACGDETDPVPSGGGGTSSAAAQATSSTPDSTPNPPEETSAVMAETKTLAYFQKYVSSGAYTTEMKMDAEGITSLMMSAYDGENIYTESEMNGTKNITILKDDAMYILDPASKVCMKMAVPPEETKELFAEESGNYETAVTTGNVEINGKNFFCEEFAVEGSSVKYCFDGDDLKYMLVDGEGQQTVIEILRMEAGVDKSLFEIPADYTMMEY